MAVYIAFWMEATGTLVVGSLLVIGCEFNIIIGMKGTMFMLFQLHFKHIKMLDCLTPNQSRFYHFGEAVSVTRRFFICYSLMMPGIVSQVSKHGHPVA